MGTLSEFLEECSGNLDEAESRVVNAYVLQRFPIDCVRALSNEDGYLNGTYCSSVNMVISSSLRYQKFYNHRFSNKRLMWTQFVKGRAYNNVSGILYSHRRRC